MTDILYNEEQQRLGQEFSEKLGAYAATASSFMHARAITNAFITVGVTMAGQYMSRGQVAEWLHGIADDLEPPAAPAPLEN